MSLHFSACIIFVVQSLCHEGYTSRVSPAFGKTAEENSGGILASHGVHARILVGCEPCLVSRILVHVMFLRSESGIRTVHYSLVVLAAYDCITFNS